MRVVVWIDPQRLPDLRVPIYRDCNWVEDSVRTVRLTDREVIWPGVLPLSAVRSFASNSDSERARLAATARSFDNVALGDLRIDVEQVRRMEPASARPSSGRRLRPPVNWNALRGAAAMAAWAVPTIDPWLDVFLDSLSERAGREHSAAALGAAWLDYPIWNSKSREGGPPLWSAIIDVLGSIEFREAWRPIELVDSIIENAVTRGADSASMSKLRDESKEVLRDKAVIDPRRTGEDPLGLALQLVLLRPKPENFLGWIERFPTMSPAVWWTGAMLCGLVTGFRDLSATFRGLPHSHDLLAVRTWNWAAPESDDTMPWPNAFAHALSWQLTEAKVQLTEADHVWAERRRVARGDWFRADYSRPDVRQQAFELAKQFAPSALKRCLRLKDMSLHCTGDGEVFVNSAGKELMVKGQVDFFLPDGVEISEEVDVDSFRDWLAIGIAPERLPAAPKALAARSPSENEHLLPGLSDRAHRSLTPQTFDSPPGLLLFPEFVSEAEERELITAVDEGPWLPDLKRRVQHYGWKYDYRARRVEGSLYLGPLPPWAARIATRLVDEGVVPQMPDQVIVNEYVGNQGISKHVDCLECFDGPVVTISLNESWGMVFRHPKDDRKVEHLLHQRSAAVMSGDAREVWTHEIPNRKKEGSVARQRRISLTFRKIRVSSATGSAGAKARAR
ncbi:MULTISPECIES: alpha-ketoglutarate-dependent dioxygenase AlkB [unclassified Caballeronia]|uniref:alpha-ketoglutarate-dependent dioxygenase AlkB n=1 Tax=unclassified Caballeronia TaxID=2646786 RepID=UPI002028BFDD|nr:MULTISPECIES: alpha-ketoglutarate-dependent dioxygenase AlkB [unclassified Caballeronia]MDR5766150.1 alpha-ketoglutarate-dependent dioxygenase AlkB [Caballeronia sp. LZ028]